MTIRAVFFDAAGTLFHPARRVGESYALIAAKYGMNVAAAEINERFRVCFDAAPRLAFPGAGPEQLSALERNWWKALVAEVFRPWDGFGEFDAYFDELFAYFADSAAWKLYPEVEQTLAGLRARGLVLDVISNFDSRLVAILEGLGVAGSFENIFVSSRVGYAKPDRRIFEVALKRHGLAASQTIHVGDSEVNDVAGANGAGLRGVLVDRSLASAPSPDSRVASLDGILSLLGS